MFPPEMITTLEGLRESSSLTEGQRRGVERLYLQVLQCHFNNERGLGTRKVLTMIRKTVNGLTIGQHMQDTLLINLAHDLKIP